MVKKMYESPHCRVIEWQRTNDVICSSIEQFDVVGQDVLWSE